MAPNSACLWVTVHSASKKQDFFYGRNSFACKQLIVSSIVVLSLEEFQLHSLMLPTCDSVSECCRPTLRAHCDREFETFQGNIYIFLRHPVRLESLWSPYIHIHRILLHVYYIIQTNYFYSETFQRI